jgi:hypothetical protein
MAHEIERVSKLDVAYRQLDQAIQLFFERRDPVAVHSLAAAAHQVLTDLGDKKGVTNFIKRNPHIREEMRREWIRRINEPYNFIKHADRDPDEVFEFRPAVTSIFILDALQLYQQLTGKLPHKLNIFLMWFNVAYPDAVSGPLKEMAEKARQAGLDPNNFEILLELIMRVPPNTSLERTRER